MTSMPPAAVAASSCVISCWSFSGSPTIPSSACIAVSSICICGPAMRRRDDLIDGCGVSLLLAQDLRVVDFDDIEARAAGRGPEVRDAAVAAHFLRRAREEQEQRAPRIGIGGSIDGQRADHVPVEDLGELADGRVGTLRQRRRRAAASRPDLQP